MQWFALEQSTYSKALNTNELNYSYYILIEMQEKEREGRVKSLGAIQHCMEDGGGARGRVIKIVTVQIYPFCHKG